MVIDMNEQQLCTVAQIRAFLDGTREVQFDPIGEDSKRYAFIGAVVRRLRYGSLSRVEKGIVMRYLERTTGYSIAQLKRLVGRVRAGETLAKRYAKPKRGFVRTFTPADVALLAHTDECSGHCFLCYPLDLIFLLFLLFVWSVSARITCSEKPWP